MKLSRFLSARKGERDASALERNDCVNLYRYTEGEVCRADREAGVPTSRSKDLSEKLRGAVDHLGMSRKVRASVHKATELNHAFKATPVSANRVGDQRDNIHGTPPRSHLSIFKSNLHTDPSDVCRLPINDRNLT